MNVVFDLGAVLIAWEPARLGQAHFPDRAGDEAAAAALAKALFHHEAWLAGLRRLRPGRYVPTPPPPALRWPDYADSQVA